MQVSVGGKPVSQVLYKVDVQIITANYYMSTKGVHNLSIMELLYTLSAITNNVRAYDHFFKHLFKAQPRQSHR